MVVRTVVLRTARNITDLKDTNVMEVSLLIPVCAVKGIDISLVPLGQENARTIKVITQVQTNASPSPRCQCVALFANSDLPPVLPFFFLEEEKKIKEK